MSRFVRPETAILKISNGDTLTVKRRLSSGEQRAAYARMYAAGADGRLKVNPAQYALGLITAYLLDWSLMDDDGRLVVIRDQSIEGVTAALDALDAESFAEIKDAIDVHETAMTAEREQEKKRQAGANGSLPPLPLLADAIGVTSGSLN